MFVARQTRPHHHFDSAQSHDHVHWTELFYDLIHVVTIFLLGNYLSHHLDLSGFIVFAGLFTALWFAWGELSVFNSIYVSTDRWHRVIMAMMIVTIMIMAAAIPSATDKGWVYFALGFALNRALIACLYLRARNVAADDGSICREQARNFLGFAALFGLSALLPKPFGFALFGLTLLATQVLYMIPSHSVLRLERFVPRIGHLMERFALLTLIVLGEGFFKLVVTLSEKGVYKVDADILVSFLIGGFVIFGLAWIYFDFVANGKLRNTSQKTLVKLWLGHLALMISAVMLGVALTGEVKVHMFEPYPLDYALLGCFGLAGFIGMIWLLETMIEPRRMNRLASPQLRIFGIVLALATLLIGPVFNSLFGNLFFATALFSQIAWPLWKGRAGST